MSENYFSPKKCDIVFLLWFLGPREKQCRQPRGSATEYRAIAASQTHRTLQGKNWDFGAPSAGSASTFTPKWFPFSPPADDHLNNCFMCRIKNEKYQWLLIKASSWDNWYYTGKKTDILLNREEKASAKSSLLGLHGVCRGMFTRNTSPYCPMHPSIDHWYLLISLL